MCLPAYRGFMPVRLVLAVVLALSAAACTSPDPVRHRSTPPPSTNAGQSSQGGEVRTSTATVSLSRPCGWRTSTTYRHVIWIWLENRPYSQVLGATGDAVHLQDWGKRCGVATHYTAITHPSLPNYIAAIGGSRFG